MATRSANLEEQRAERARECSDILKQVWEMGVNG